MKGGLIAMRRAAAVESAAQRIHVNAVVPSMVGTPASVAPFEESTLAERRSAMPLGRFGEPHDIAVAEAVLAGDDGSCVTGQCHAIDGGVSSTHPHGRIPV